MTPRFVLEPAAERDLVDALTWYQEHAPAHGYVVYFVILPDALSGIAVFHTSRDPAMWRQRADI